MVDIIKFLQDNDCTHIRVINGKIYAIRRFMFTTGLMVGLDEFGYEGRYCYEHRADAINALNEWDGNGDPSGNWIKYKGKGGERSNDNPEK